ncbi:MAG: class I SAM-dependent methyltransferase [Candidatus Vogelbacteria bacterium]|nr:class I SAM-dependent methyltransferase [Candidatus Vogelbacteria bacterium]
MEVLGLAECIASFKYCKKCHHIFRDPLYDDSELYNERAVLARKKAYEKYNNKPYTSEAVENLSNNFSRAFIFSARQLKKHALAAERIGKILLSRNSNKIIKILDYGAGSGYFLDLFAVIFSKVLLFENIEFYNYDLGVENSMGDPHLQPQFVNNEEQLSRLAPFDLIICNDVLEHLSKPPDLIKHAYDLLGQNGVLFVEVPSELTALRKQIGLSFHISFFTRLSLRRLLMEAGFSSVESFSDAFSCYRGVSSSVCQAIGVKGVQSMRKKRINLDFFALAFEFVRMYSAAIIRVFNRR